MGSFFGQNYFLFLELEGGKGYKMNQLTENLDTILDNFQMVVNSGQTCSVYRDTKTNWGSSYEPIINIHQSEKVIREKIDLGSLKNFDGLYPIIPLKEKNKMSKKSRRNYRTKDILVNFNITDEDKDLMKKWFLSGGLVKEFTFCGKRGYTRSFPLRNRDWWYFTKGLLFRFHNYLTTNLLCEDLTTIDEKLSLVLRDIVLYHTRKDLVYYDDYDDKKFIPLETLYEDKEIENEEEVKIKEELKELKSQVQELITQLKTKEEELESLVI